MTASIVALLLAYLLGSLSGSLMLGRLVGVDIRTRGSGNAGGTNALRTLGWKFALGVLLIDVGKGALAAWIGLTLQHAALQPSPQSLAFTCTLAAAAGHTWPVFFGFRGGKGAGTLAGGMLVAWPASVLPVLMAWLLVLTVTGFVGLATVCAGFALVAFALWSGAYELFDPRLLFALAAATFIAFTHRGNLARLHAGTEYRFERARIWARLLTRRGGDSP